MCLASQAEKLFFLACMLFSSPYCKAADIVDTKSRGVYKGVITEEDSASVCIELEGGYIKRIPRSDVLRIRRVAASQNKGTHQTNREKGAHRHDGFYLSMGMGAQYAAMEAVSMDGRRDTLSLSGGGIGMEVRLGVAIVENWILSGDVITGSIVNPRLAVNGARAGTSTDTTGSLGVVGLGLTRYFDPSNIFVSGTVGYGGLLVFSQGTDEDLADSDGLILQLMFGKEWWVSRNWGLGLSLNYQAAGVGTRNQAIQVLFSATYN